MWLMNEPASMMDLGLLKVNIELQSFNFEGVSTPIAFYDWDNDDIAIWTRSIPSESRPETESDARKSCGEWFRKIRTHFLVDPDTGQPISGFRSIVHNFNHNGFKRGLGNEPDFEVNLAKKVMLQYVLHGRFGKMTCTGRLEDKSFTFAIVEG